MTKSELIDALSATRSTTKKTGRRAS
jgi:hypothetical protein